MVGGGPRGPRGPRHKFEAELEARREQGRKKRRALEHGTVHEALERRRGVDRGRS